EGARFQCPTVARADRLRHWRGSSCRARRRPTRLHANGRETWSAPVLLSSSIRENRPVQNPFPTLVAGPGGRRGQAGTQLDRPCSIILTGESTFTWTTATDSIANRLVRPV